MMCFMDQYTSAVVTRLNKAVGVFEWSKAADVEFTNHEQSGNSGQVQLVMIQDQSLHRYSWKLQQLLPRSNQ